MKSVSMSINGLENKIIFQGFDSPYKEVLNIEDQLLWLEVQVEAEETFNKSYIEDQLLWLEVQAEAEETFDDLKKSFESFQSKIRMVSLKAKRKKFQNLRQITINDMFN